MSYFNYQSAQLFYETEGSGPPLLLLHGNTASSRMFHLVKPLYQQHFTIILMDFLGYGQSDRVSHLPANFYHQQALQAIALTEYLGLRKISIVGTSGGAVAALNAALERPDLVSHVVADSFDGRNFHSGFAAELIRERTAAQQDQYTRLFYQWCLGDDWQKVVEQDTKALLACAQSGTPLFEKPLHRLTMPVLLTGTKGDTMVRQDFQAEYARMAANMAQPHTVIFEDGAHPAILTNPEAMAALIIEFIIGQ